MMKKLLLTTIAIIGLLSLSSAQDKQMMMGVNAGINGAGCTNCGLQAGIGVSYDYAVTENLVAGFVYDRYTDSDNSSWGNFKLIVRAVGVAANYYPKEAYKGFFIGPDLSYVTIIYKADGTRWGTPQNNLTAGLNLGWVISIGENIGLVPHFGYGTWFDGAKGRVTMGARLAYKL